MHLFSHNEFTLNLIPLNIFERLWLWDLPYRLIYQYFFFLTKKLTGKNANRIRFILSLLNNILSDISRLNSQKTSWLLKYQWFYKCLIAESKIFYPISIFYETSCFLFLRRYIFLFHCLQIVQIYQARCNKLARDNFNSIWNKELQIYRICTSRSLV